MNTIPEKVKAQREEIINFMTWMLDQADNGVEFGGFKDMQDTFIAGQLLASPEAKRVARRLIDGKVTHVARRTPCRWCGAVTHDEDNCTGADRSRL